MLFPHVMLRVAGRPFDTLAELKAPHTTELVTKITQAEQHCTAVGNKLAQALYALVPTVGEKKGRRKLIALRRDVLNNRPISPSKVAAAEAWFSAEITPQLQTYQQQQQHLQSLQTAYATTYASETAQARTALRHCINDEKFQQGLLLSSHTLSEHGVARYTQARHPLNKDALQAERGLLKYMTRMVGKTSPFSTFTNLAMGVVDQSAENQNLLIEPCETGAMESNLRLNANLFAYLRSLIIRIPTVYRHLPLCLNPTLTQQEETFHFLTNANNVECFQRIAVSPILTLFYQLLDGHNAGIVYQQLCAEILQNNYIDTNTEQLEQFLNQLIAYGFLAFNLPISGLDPKWDFAFVALLEPMAEHDPLIAELVTWLREMRTLMAHYPHTAVPLRREQLQTQHSHFAALQSRLNGLLEPIEEETEPDTFQHLVLDRSRFRPESLLYEDTALPMTPRLNAKPLKRIVSALDCLLQALQPFDNHRVERERMAAFFLNRYGDAGSVDLLEFYETYYREVKQAVKPEETPAHKRSEKWWAALGEQVDIRPNTPSVNITFADLTIANQTLDYQHVPLVNGRSFGAFVQFCGDKALINGCFPGYGKMVGRFLHLFDDAVTLDLRTANAARASDHLFLENGDASCFNANIHPPLLPFEISLPNGHNSLPSDQQIPITELVVRLHPTQKRLQLLHTPTQKIVSVFDLGFQGRKGRSELFDLLMHFDGNEYLSAYTVVYAINKLSRPKDETEIIIRPRITYEDTLILQRKGWEFPTDRLPHRETQQTDANYFQHVRRWQIEHQLPNELFVTITQRRRGKGGNKNARRDDYKPQLIDLTSPLSVLLFEKLLTKVGDTLKIEEMSPTPEQLLSFGTDKHVTEAVLHWYR